jgi:hypothetical protein
MVKINWTEKKTMHVTSVAGILIAGTEQSMMGILAGNHVMSLIRMVDSLLKGQAGLYSQILENRK